MDERCCKDNFNPISRVINNQNFLFKLSVTSMLLYAENTNRPTKNFHSHPQR